MVDTTDLITTATTARGKLMNLLPLDLIPMLMLMAMVSYKSFCFFLTVELRFSGYYGGYRYRPFYYGYGWGK